MLLFVLLFLLAVFTGTSFAFVCFSLWFDLLFCWLLLLVGGGSGVIISVGYRVQLQLHCKQNGKKNSLSCACMPVCTFCGVNTFWLRTVCMCCKVLLAHVFMGLTRMVCFHTILGSFQFSRTHGFVVFTSSSCAHFVVLTVLFAHSSYVLSSFGCAGLW